MHNMPDGSRNVCVIHVFPNKPYIMLGDTVFIFPYVAHYFENFAHFMLVFMPSGHVTLTSYDRGKVF